MSTRRLVATTAAMALIAGALALLTPGISSMAATLAAPQRTVDTAGPDALVISAAGLLAWVVWAWGALGLTLTAASALPGMFGGAARVVLHVVLPAGARARCARPRPGARRRRPAARHRGADGPHAGGGRRDWTPQPTAGVPDWPAVPTALPTPDWPTTTGPQDPAPDWPAATATADTHVVVRGDCLWHIASDRLLTQHGRMPTDGEVAAASQAWWQANAEVIGPDPDLLLPGQVLSPPDPS